MNEPRPRPIIAAAALASVVLATATALLAAIELRFGAAERAYARPWADSRPPGEWLLAGLGALTLAAAVVSWFALRDAERRRALVVGLLWPSLPLAAAWLLVPAAGPVGPATVAGGVAVALAACWLRRGEPSTRAATRSRPGWIVLHAVMVVALAAIGAFGDGFADPRAFLLSLLLYPVYAFCQLYLVLGVLWPRLRRLAGDGAAGPVVTASLVFALIHWPNPALMLLTGGGMAFWATARSHDRGLATLALSMGLLATLAAQGLPDRWTDHMRVGPRFVRQRSAPALADTADRHTRHLAAGRPRTSAFLADLYPGIVGRKATPDELDRWWLSVEGCRRGVLAWRFFIGEEYHRKFGAPAGEAPLPGDVHWTRLPSPWPERIGTFTRGGSVSREEHLAHLYREILHREATAEELAAWDRDLSPRQRRRLVEVLLEQRRALASTPFDTCTCQDLLLHH